MNLLEKMVVTEEFCKRDDVYNIKIGGDGGWDHVNASGHNVPLKEQYLHLSPEQKIALHKKSVRTRSNWSREYRENYTRHQSITALIWHQKHPGYFAGERNPMYGHVDSEETRQKKIMNHLGSKNSQYGKMWICNDLTKESTRIMKSDPIPEGWRKGRICKK